MITYDERKGRLLRWLSGFKTGCRAGQAMQHLKTNLADARRDLQALEAFGLLVKDDGAWSINRNNSNQIVFNAPFYAVYSTVHKNRGVDAPEIAALNGLSKDETEAILNYLVDLDLIDYKRNKKNKEREFFYCYDD